MAQVVSCRTFKGEERVCFRVSHQFRICGVQSDTGRALSKRCSISPVSIIPPWALILIYHPGMSNRPVGGRSSETWSHPIDMNNDNGM
jgi:hypothetical protein